MTALSSCNLNKLQILTYLNLGTCLYKIALISNRTKYGLIAVLVAYNKAILFSSLYLLNLNFYLFYVQIKQLLTDVLGSICFHLH